MEQYLEKYVGELVEVRETKDIINIGSKFPDGYSGSQYTRKTKGVRAKAKARELGKRFDDGTIGAHAYVELVCDRNMVELDLCEPK